MVLSRIWLRSRRNASIAVSIRWIASPNLQVTILTTMRAIDFSSEDIDCSIRHGAGSWPELDNSDLTAPAAERILHAAHSIEQLTSRELITSLERSMRIPCLIALAGVLGLTAQGQAQVARQEVHPVQSVTLSDTEFLSGKQDGKPVTLAGVLRLPKVGPEKLPAVVLLHGAGGMGGSGSSIDEWSQELNQIGIATFAVDSWSGRGIVETQTDQTRAGRLNRIVDAYRALELLAKHRQIDPARIAVMGFSHGGQSTCTPA